MAYFDHFAGGKPTRLGNALAETTMTQYYRDIDTRLNHSTDLEILEIGPGLGQLAKLFIAGGYSGYDIVEPNDLMRDNLAKAGVRHCKNYLIPELQERDNSYDAIILMDVFEHLNGSKEAWIFASEANRVLKPSGFLFLLSPDYNDWQKDFFNCDFSHNNVTTVRRALQLFENSGFIARNFQYHYACLGGTFGFTCSRLVKALTAFQAGHQNESKLYKLRLTFLRRFSIVAQKNDHTLIPHSPDVVQSGKRDS